MTEKTQEHHHLIRDIKKYVADIECLVVLNPSFETAKMCEDILNKVAQKARLQREKLDKEQKDLKKL